MDILFYNMVKHVVKRDGRVVIFDNRKIVDAILKAMNVTEEGEDIVLAAEIASAISKINVDNMSVEDIQDQVENELMNSPRKEVAKKYIAYRNQRNLARRRSRARYSRRSSMPRQRRSPGKMPT